MKISSVQLNQINSAVLEEFSRKTATQLIDAYPEWEHESSREERRQRVLEIIRYGQRLGLDQRDALFRFAGCIVHFGLGIPLPQPLLDEFRQPGISRAAQVENLLLRLLSGRDSKILITL
ncbi:hypothetical protein [Archangium violaceum]|nr:hypothetical protein [Archangium violaceum]